MNSETDKTADALLSAKRNQTQVQKDFQNGNATVQDLKTAQTRTRRAATNRLRYLDKVVNGK